MNKMYQLLIPQLQKELEINKFKPNCKEFDDQNVWIMALSVKPYNPLPSFFSNFNFSSSNKYPTHIVRVILRTNSSFGLSEYVDGTDILVLINEKEKLIDINSFASSWIEGSPIYHGGTIKHALNWIKEIAEPIYIQLEDPFLNN